MKNQLLAAARGVMKTRWGALGCLALALGVTLGSGSASAQCSTLDSNMNGVPDDCPVGTTNVIIGDATSETLTGTSGNDCIFGLGGADTIDGLAGSDYLCGPSIRPQTSAPLRCWNRA